MSTPFWRFNYFLIDSISAISAMLSILKGDKIPEEGEKKAGKYLLW